MEFVQRTARTLPVQSWLYSLTQECPQAALRGRYNLELDFSGVLKDIWTVIFQKKKQENATSVSDVGAGKEWRRI